MGLNYLLHRHQVSLMRAEASASGEARIVHGKLASAYADRIARVRDQAGAEGAFRLPLTLSGGMA